MASPEKLYLVSACLLGVACRYDGESRKNEAVLKFLSGKRFVPICPESLSGLPTPRPPSRFESGDGSMARSGKARLVSSEGKDVSKQFVHGAVETLKIARLVRPTDAILKDRSPSCGVYQVYSGGKLARGIGCFTSLLLLEGVSVRSEQDVEDGKA